MGTDIRKIIHIDMDCFYAAVEIRDNPKLNGYPVAIGGRANARGVLSTCNYQAREYGLHSAMASYRALELCSDLVLLPVNMPKYKAVSERIRKILAQFTSVIEPLSLDEAYLDVSHSGSCNGSATLIAQQIRQDIFKQEQLTASAGIAPNKLLAKIASDWNKPDGQYVITPEMVESFVATLAVQKIFGVGKVTANKLSALKVQTCADLQKLSKVELSDHFGSFGAKLYDYARGIDHRPVEPDRIRKSASVELTYNSNISGIIQCLDKLPELMDKLLVRLQPHHERTIHKQYVKIKFADFTQTTAECLSSKPDCDKYILLLQEAHNRQVKTIRLLGIGVRFTEDEQHYATEEMQFEYQNRS